MNDVRAGERAARGRRDLLHIVGAPVIQLLRHLAPLDQQQNAPKIVIPDFGDEPSGAQPISGHR